MLYIWNNKSYWRLSEGVEWDQTEFVLARKLYIEFKVPHRSIRNIKNVWTIYGAIEKIETFRDDYSKINVAHITFKDSSAAFLVLEDFKANELTSNVNLIRLAPTHNQPDWLLDSSNSNFYSLPTELLIAIFDLCDIHALAALSQTCKKMSQLIKDVFFPKILNGSRLLLEPSAGEDFSNCLITATHLIKSINPISFCINIRRRNPFPLSHQTYLHYFDYSRLGDPVIDINFESSNGNELIFDSDLFLEESMCKFKPIAKRIQSVQMNVTFVDCLLQKFVVEPKLLNVTTLNIQGLQVPAFNVLSRSFYQIIDVLPKLERISIQNFDLINQFLDFRDLFHSNCLRRINFQGCFNFKWLTEVEIRELANTLRKSGIANLLITYDTDYINYTLWTSGPEIAKLLKMPIISRHVKFDFIDNNEMN